MNYLVVTRLLGLLFLVLALCMGVSLFVEYFGFAEAGRAERMAVYALTFATVITAAVGGVAWLIGRRGTRQAFNRRDALLLVAVGWVLGAALSALPYYAWAKLGGAPTLMTVLRADSPLHPFHSFMACYFEAMSGLTTTGATVLAAVPNDIESLPKGLLLWRAITHWLGGLGIVVLFVAVLPVVGVGGKKLFQVEAAGPTAKGVRPRIGETARVLWLIYVALTVAQTVAYRLAGMPWFDAVCHTFATLATGGFSTKNASIGAYYDTPAVGIITIVFMVLAGVNFGLYYQLFARRFHNIFRDPELRLYLMILGVSTLVIAGYIWGDAIPLTTGELHRPGVLNSVRDSAFQVSSIMTTTGYATVDFDKWPFMPKAILIALMFTGGCAGSTGGGLKVIRVLIAGKVILAEFERVFRPQIVKPIRVASATVDSDLARSVLIYILLIVVLFYLGAVALMLFEPAGSLDFTSAATASIATLMNVGPGLRAVGAVQNYGFFSTPSLAVMSLLMALGRLEVFALLVLLVPRFWRET